VPTLLVTGFEPFGPYEVNSRWEAASRVADRVRGKVAAARLPVDHTLAREILLQVLSAEQPWGPSVCGLPPRVSSRSSCGPASHVSSVLCLVSGSCMGRGHGKRWRWQ
jgi:hypothetical protein